MQDRAQLLAVLNGLATIASITITRSCPFAKELRLLVRRYMRDAQYALSIEEMVGICLVAASSHTSLNDWRDFSGDWLTEMAFGNLKDDDGKVLHSLLQLLCHVVPELWISCGRSDAALRAYNEQAC